MLKNIKLDIRVIMSMLIIFTGVMICLTCMNVSAMEYIIEHDTLGTNPVNLPEFTRSGFSTASGIHGYQGGTATGSLCTTSRFHWAQWTPAAGALAPGNYKVYIWKVVRSDTVGGRDTSVNVETVHKVDGILQTETYTLSQTGTAGWIALGTFEFAGTGDEYVKLTRTTTSSATDADGKMIYTHADSVKFEKVEDPADNAYLSNMQFNTGILSPAFNKDILSYTVEVEMDSITLTATAENELASISVNGQSINSSSPMAINLAPGVNTINVQVVSSNLSQTKTYTISIRRKLIIPDFTHDDDENIEWLEEGAINCKLNISNHSSSIPTTLVLCLYKNNVLYSVDIDQAQSDIEGGIASIHARVVLDDSNVELYKVKAYIWNNVLEMIPLGDPKVFPQD